MDYRLLPPPPPPPAHKEGRGRGGVNQPRYPPHQGGQQGRGETDLLALENARTIAAVDGDGTVLGYASLQTVLDEGYINNLAVLPAYRRLGIASALLEDFRRFGEAKGLAFLTLEVRASNAPAIALYAKHGYTQAGRRKNYYSHPKEDAILMTLEFTRA